MVEPDKTGFFAAELVHGFPTNLVSLVWLVGVGKIGGVTRGANGDGAPAAAETEVAHPAAAGVRHRYGRRTAIIVG